MIEKVTIIDAQYSGLEKYFPGQLELEVNSPIVLLVGPNGSGKTAFIRLLASSIQNDIYFRQQGVARKWKPFEQSIPSLKEPIWGAGDAHQGLGAWYYPGAGLVRVCCSEAKRNALYDLGLDEKRDIKEFGENAVDPYLNNKFRPDWNGFYHLISASALEKLQSLPSLISQDNEFNRWRYLKVSPSRTFYLQEFRLPLDEFALKLKDKRYTVFDELYDGKDIVPSESLRRRIEEMARIRTLRNDDPENTYAQLLRERHQLIDIIDGKRKDLRRNPSPGQELRENIEQKLMEIEFFFDERICPRWTANDEQHLRYYGERSLPDYLLDGVRRDSVEGELKRYESVPTDAELIVFMDEPTIYLDYQHKYEFAQKIRELAQKYSPRLQFFIPTNDAVLIEKMPDCRYLNLYKQPAVVTSSFSL